MQFEHAHSSEVFFEAIRILVDRELLPPLQEDVDSAGLLELMGMEFPEMDEDERKDQITAVFGTILLMTIPEHGDGLVVVKDDVTYVITKMVDEEGAYVDVYQLEEDADKFEHAQFVSVDVTDPKNTEKYTVHGQD